MAKSKFEHSVDEILKTVQQRQADRPPSNDAAVDEILAGLGMGNSLYSTLKRPASALQAVPQVQTQAAAEQTPAAAPVRPEPEPEPAGASQPEKRSASGTRSAAGRPKEAPAPIPEARPAPAEKPPKRPEPEPATESRPEPEKTAQTPRPQPAAAPQKTAPAPESAPEEAAAPEAAAARAADKAADTSPADKAGDKSPADPRPKKPGRVLRTPAKPAEEKPPQRDAEQTAPLEEPAPDPDEENEPTREFDPVAGAEKPAAPRRTPPETEPSFARTVRGEAAAADAGEKAAEKGPSIRPLETKTGVLHLNEIVDEEFTKFFSETVAVVPEEEKQEEPGGFFRRRRRAKAAPPPEEETLRPDDGLTGEVRLDQDGPLELAELDGPPEEEDGPPPRRRFVLPRIFGVEEPEEDGPFTDEEPEELLDDYAAREDAPSVQADLTRKCAALRLRFVLTGLIAALLLYLGLCAGGALPSIPSIDPAVAPAAYLGVSLLLLAAAAAVSFGTMQAGLAGLFGTPSPSSMPALAVLAAAVQLIVLLLGADRWQPGSMTLFAAPAALLLCLDAAGKRMMSGVIERNFELVSSGIDHVAAYRLRDKKLAEKAAAGLAEPEPDLLVNRPTALVKGFLHQSFSERWSDRVAQRLCWALWGSAVLAAVIAAVKGGGLSGAVTVLAGTLCLGGPLSCTLLAAVPSLLMQQSACRVGAVVPGWSAVHEMSRANVVAVGARDLFPSRSVVLHGIKTFEKERIDLAILYAASVLIEGCDTLKDVFLSIIQNKTEMLYPVENLTHEVGGGFIAWVEHNRVILGGREMMESHDIDVPSMDYEDRYTRNGRYRPIYLAVSGKLFGMFVVSYRPDPEVAEVLRQLRRSGISVLVKSDDFSVTPALIQRVYRMREGSVKVLSGEERKLLAPATAYLPESEGCMTHLGSFASFVGGLLAAESAAGGERAAAMVQAVSVVCSCGLALLLAVTGGLASLALPALILYQSAWSALALAMPLLKKY